MTDFKLPRRQRTESEADWADWRREAIAKGKCPMCHGDLIGLMCPNTQHTGGKGPAYFNNDGQMVDAPAEPADDDKIGKLIKASLSSSPVRDLRDHITHWLNETAGDAANTVARRNAMLDEVPSMNITEFEVFLVDPSAPATQVQIGELALAMHARTGFVLPAPAPGSYVTD